MQAASLLKCKIDKLTLKLVLWQNEGAQLMGFYGFSNCIYRNVNKTFFEFLKSKMEFCQILVASSLKCKTHKLTLKLVL